jgi:hypothetical protein
MPEQSNEVSALRWASQPRKFVWERWLDHLLPLGVPLDELRERYKPSVREVCEPLLGVMEKVPPADGNGPLMKNTMLPRGRRIEIFRQVLYMIKRFESWRDLRDLAVFRRQVDNSVGVALIDEIFWRLSVRAGAALSPRDLQFLAVRMPTKTLVRKRLVLLALERATASVEYQLVRTARSLHEEQRALLAHFGLSAAE